MQWLSRGKFDRLPRTTVGFTTSAFDGYGLRRRSSLRPAPQASDPLLVHRLACLLCASFRPRLATRPLRFTITSRPSRCEEDLHLQAIEHARHTNKSPPVETGGLLQRLAKPLLKQVPEELVVHFVVILHFRRFDKGTQAARATVRRRSLQIRVPRFHVRTQQCADPLGLFEIL